MKKWWRDLAFVSIGAALLALAIHSFLLPARISTGGISGIATVLFYFGGIPLFFTTLVLNLILFIFSYRILSPAAIPKNLAGIVLLSLFLKLFEGIPVYEKDPLMGALVGGIVAGMGVGTALLRESSTGGTDLAALLLHKKFPHLSPSFFIMVQDTVIITVSALVFRDLTVMFYSLLSLYISNKVVDGILTRGSFAKLLLIVSRNSDAIAQSILSRLNRGVTGLYMQSGYEKREGKMLFCVVRNRQVPALLSLVNDTDSAAFTVILDARRVHGEGFD